MWLLLAFIAVPVIEIALFIQVGGAIGLFPTLAIVILTAILGTWLVRAQGVTALANLGKSFNQMQDPTEPLAHGAMILFAGALLLTPGFFTDATGFALLMPPVRVSVFNFLRKRVKVQSFSAHAAGQGPFHDPRQPRPSEKDVIEGEFVDLDDQKKPTHETSGWTKH